MKTSNKWILGFFLTTVLSSLVIYKFLYSEYNKGHFVTARQIHDEQFINQPIRKPRVIALDGTVWVNLIPADRFALELPRNNKDADAGLFQTGPAIKLKIGSSPTAPAITWRQNGDTLFIKGNFDHALHRPWSNYYNRAGLPQVNLLGPAVDEILLNNGQLYLQGAPARSDRLSTRLTIRNSTLWLGMQYESGSHPDEFFDSLDIRSNNSITIINTAADLGYLRMALTDSSQVHDQFAALGSSVIQSSPDSRVELTGSNLKKTQLIIR
ncbi:MAG TPA: hypothetical protein VGM89_00480 [Puia sp.]